MQEWQAYVDALGLTCRVWRAQDPTASSPEKGSYQYENRMLTQYTGTKTRIHPHLTVSKEPVVGLGDGVFKGSQTIEYFSVSHNDAFTTIGAEAFMDSALQNVDLFDSVTTIGARAFAGCAKLEALTLPESLTEIGEGALDGLTGLKKLVIKCDPALIPAGVFANLPELADVTIETGAIPAHMFEGSGVTTLALGEGVTEIGESAFAGTKLSTADLPKRGRHRRGRVRGHDAEHGRSPERGRHGHGRVRGRGAGARNPAQRRQRGRARLCGYEAGASGHPGKGQLPALRRGGHECGAPPVRRRDRRAGGRVERDPCPPVV